MTTPQNAACALSPGGEDRIDLESILYFNLTSSPPATVLEPPTALDMENPLFNNDEQSVFVSARLSNLEAAIAGGNAKIAHLDNRIMELDFLVVFVTKIFGNQTSERDGGV
ncbi:hypothetical protein GGI35DRAFT_469851 [Trichoderma velutinum]